MQRSPIYFFPYFGHLKFSWFLKEPFRGWRSIFFSTHLRFHRQNEGKSLGIKNRVPSSLGIVACEVIYLFSNFLNSNWDFQHWKQFEWKLVQFPCCNIVKKISCWNSGYIHYQHSTHSLQLSNKSDCDLKHTLNIH